MAVLLGCACGTAATAAPPYRQPESPRAPADASNGLVRVVVVLSPLHATLLAAARRCIAASLHQILQAALQTLPQCPRRQSRLAGPLQLGCPVGSTTAGLASGCAIATGLGLAP